MTTRIFVLTGLLAVATASQAITFNFGQVINGPGNATPNPAVRLDINQFGANTVRFTVTNLAAPTSTQAPKSIWLNMDPFRGGYSTSNVGSSFDSFMFANNGITDSGYDFDMQIELKVSGPNRLGGGASQSFDLTAVGLLENDFLAMTPNTNNNPSSLMAMTHVISTPNGESVKLGIVPEPGTFAALGLALIPALRRRFKK